MTDKVVGVSCELGDSPPTVILKGAGGEAHALVDRARALGDVPIVKDPQLVDELYRVPLDTPIGRELFPVMAAVLVHVLQVDKAQQRKLRGSADE